MSEVKNETDNTLNTESRDAGTDETKLQPRPPRKAITGWVLFLPILLLSGAWWMRQSEQPSDDSTMPLLAATPEVTPTRKATAQPAPKDLTFTLYQLDENAMLQRKTVPATLPAPTAETLSGSQARTHYKEQAATIALQKLMAERPKDFPPGAELLWFKIQGGIPTANFNREFLDESFWQGSARVLGTTQIIAHTLVDNKNIISGSEDDSVRFLVEEQPIDILGELEFSEPVAPDASMVAKR